MGCLMTSSDDVMFFFSFGPWAIFLSTRIFEFRPKFFFDFSHLLIFFIKSKTRKSLF